MQYLPYLNPLLATLNFYHLPQRSEGTGLNHASSVCTEMFQNKLCNFKPVALWKDKIYTDIPGI